MNISCPPVYVAQPYNEELTRHDRLIKIITSSIQVALAVPTILSNLLISWTILKTNSLRTPSYILLCSLACTDLGAGLVSLPVNAFWRIQELTENSAKICSTFDVLFSSGWAFFSASELTVTGLCVERYLAIRWGLLYRHRVTNSRVIKAVFCIWIIAVLWSIASVTISPRLLHGTVIIVGIVTFGAIFLCCILSLKALIGIEKKTFIGRTKIHVERKMISPMGNLSETKMDNRATEEVKCTKEQPLELKTCRLFSNVKENGSTSNDAPPKFRLVKYRYTIFTLFWIVVVLVLCYAPYFFLSFAVVSIGMTNEVVVAWTVAITGLCINSFLNPLIYFWRFRELRRECLKTLKKSCFCRIQLTIKKTKGSKEKETARRKGVMGTSI